jgi:peptidoglycan/xylan/chitin deacetylase (PgdA/CDA1 family)
MQPIRYLPILSAAVLTAFVAAVGQRRPRLVGCVPAGPSVVHHGPSGRRQIALTFDDGPWFSPPAIEFVNLLARYRVPATFFEIGRQLSAYDPTGFVQRRMLADGDMIGDHTWSHSNMVGLQPAEQTAQLERTARAIARMTGFTPCLWRPPYGAIDPRLVASARALGLLTVKWDLDPQDWAQPGVGAIVDDVLDHVHNGAIVIEHFGGGRRFQTLAAIPREIAALQSRGYRFVTVTQLLGLKLIYK